MKVSQLEKTVYSLQSFLEVDVSLWGNLLKEHHIACMGEEASYSQRKAWFDCFNILRREINLLPLTLEQKRNIFIVFEYELPRERGRRPDVLLLSGENLIVLEFKGYAKENHAQVDQVNHYARDLKNYHERSHNLNVIPALVLASARNISHEIDGVSVVSGDKLHTLLHPLIFIPFENISKWFNSEYAPLPSLLHSAQQLFKEKRLPQIKKAHSAGIPITLQKLTSIVKRAELEHTRHLALITGVPGAGKTLVGLQFVFEAFVQDRKQMAVFLSGNGPLVQVLQFSLSNNNFVQLVHGFLKQYAHGNQVPSEDVIIYDEAQRAWDAERVSNSPRPGSNAEPTDFINIGNKKQHCLLIGLIGEGQEIHVGEESGMRLWEEAIRQSPEKWVIHCPEKLISTFSGLDVEVVKEFNLTTSLRTHQALTLQKWVELLLDSKIPQASKLSLELFNEAYPIYITRNLDEAKTYARAKYLEEPSKTYGLIATSKNKILPSYGVSNDYNSSKSFSVSQYYVDSKHPAYCRNLSSVVTEFGCQGLELDMPILAWEFLSKPIDFPFC